MKNVVGPRREIGIRTIFNILGPLTNPAGAQSQVLGVFQAELTEMLAEVLVKLGIERAFVVHGMDGLDEISICSSTKITEVKNGRVETYYIEPEDYGLHRAEESAIVGGNAAENSKIILAVLQGEKGPRRDIVLLNTAAALIVGNKAADLETGIVLAADSIDSGRALMKLRELQLFSVRELQ
jgi:anthranilate phosphoribosyltransferase